MSSKVEEAPVCLSFFKIHEDSDSAASKTNHRCSLVVRLGDVSVEVAYLIELSHLIKFGIAELLVF